MTEPVADSEPIRFGDVRVCPVCGCLVLTANEAVHHEWHGHIGSIEDEAGSGGL